MNLLQQKISYLSSLFIIWTALGNMNLEAQNLSAVPLPSERGVLCPPDSESASQRRQWKENLGQLADPLGHGTPWVKYYSEGASPATFLTNEVLAFVWSRIDTNRLTPDTLHRVDLMLVDGQITTPIPSEQASGIENFYLGHKPEGVEGVRSFARLVCKDVYEGIDLHYYSNATGLKLYFVTHEGYDAQRPRLQFSHADSVGVTPCGGLRVQSSIGGIEFRRATVFRIGNNGQRIPMNASGSFYEAAPGEFAVMIEPHPGNLPVVVQIDEGPEMLSPTAASPEWGTFYGGNGPDACVDMDVDANGYLYVTGETVSTDFPERGNYIFQFSGSQDIYIGRFDQFYVLEWMTYYGGDGYERAATVASDAATGRVYFAGGTEITSTNPMPQHGQPGLSPYLETYTAPMYTGFLGGFDNASGERIWVSYFGGFNAMITGLEADGNGNIYGVGGTFELSTLASSLPTGGPFPICGASGAYIQSVNNPVLPGAGQADGIIFKFDDQGLLQWSTLWGGNGNEILTDVGIDAINGWVYVVGATQSTNIGITGCPTPSTYMPLCDAGGYFQNKVNGTNNQQVFEGDGMIARFDLNGRLNWSSFFGGKFLDGFSSIAVVNSPQIPGSGSNPGDIYISGYTTTPGYGSINCAQTHIDGFPGCHLGAAYTQPFGGDYDAFIVRFAADTRLSWSTFIGGSGREYYHGGVFFYGTRVISDRDGNVFIAGNTNTGAGSNGQMPYQVYSPFYDQSLHGDNSSSTVYVDGWVYGFAQNAEMVYGSYFGGTNDDHIMGIAMDDGKVYVGGKTQSWNNFPLNNPTSLPGTAYFRGYPVTGFSDAHYAQIELTPSTSIPTQPQSKSPGLRASPNPTLGTTTLDWVSMEEEDCLIQVFNSIGISLRKFSLQVRPGPTSIKIELGDLPSGSYFVTLNSAGHQLSTKILVQ